jgi:hypothetical protein
VRQSTVIFQWHGSIDRTRFKSGVALHGHTLHSRESLETLEACVRGVRPVAWHVRRQLHLAPSATWDDEDRFPSSRVVWTPPVSAREADRLERRAIEHELDLTAMVSLTDHDSTDAARDVRAGLPHGDAVISTEWTVPRGPDRFHIGVHNLPAGEAAPLVQEMARYTARPADRRLRDLLATLDELPGVLIVLNHPMWDLAGIGAEAHVVQLSKLNALAGHQIHAVEVNAMRPWAENQDTIDLAYAWSRPIVSGGDRHGFEPAGIVNLSPETSFRGFVQLVRQGASTVFVTNRYRRPLAVRLLRLLRELVDDRTDAGLTRRFRDRIFAMASDNTWVPLAQWPSHTMPPALAALERSMQLASTPVIRQALTRWLCLESHPVFA